MLERAAQSRSRLKLAVFTSIGISVVGLTAMLIGGQGCKREEAVPPTTPPETIPAPSFDPGTNSGTYQPTPDPAATTSGSTYTGPTATSSNTTSDYSVPPATATTTATTTAAPPATTGPTTTTTTPPPPEPTVGAREYVIKQGDTFASIAKKEGLGTKAIEKANPGVDPRKLKINRKIVLPAPTPKTESAHTAVAAPAGGEGGGYVVKSGDTLSKIAKQHGVGVPALRKANHLTTDRIKVNQKLVIPAKPPGAAPAETVPAPGSAPATTPYGGGIPPA